MMLQQPKVPVRLWSVVDSSVEPSFVPCGYRCNCDSLSSGLGQVPWVLFSEYLPLNVRGLAGGIDGVAAWVSAAIVAAGSFLTFSEALGAWTTWWTLTCMLLWCFLWRRKARSWKKCKSCLQQGNYVEETVKSLESMILFSY